MANDLYEITGRVIDGTTKEGVVDLRVEAWDKDVKYNDLLGSAITNADGGFGISFDTSYFREYSPDVRPDIFFKVFAGKKMVKSTEDAPIKNAKMQETVTIVINMPEFARPVGKDRISTEQVFKAAAFFQDSDFMGVYSNFRKQAGTSIGFISDMVMNTITKFDFEPVKVTGVRSDEIVNNDVADVTGNLQNRNIAVAEIRDYNPGMNAESFNTIKTLPKNLKAGQRVNLYQENGKVRYYSIVQDSNVLNTDSVKVVDDQKKQLDDIQKELSLSRKTIAEKDEQLLQLNNELKTIRENQEKINSMLNSDSFTNLMKNVQNPVQPVKRTIKPPK